MSERLSAAGKDHIVCVATEYGELVMQPDEHADIRRGRLDEGEMEKLIFEEASAVFDATHPYATAVSENIRAACEALETGYVRILRDEQSADAAYGVRIFDDAASCAETLKSTEGNILLTTGSKDLAVYAEEPEVRERLFARVLPSVESIKLCDEAGISGRQIIAMQGPFSCEMNSAVIRQYGISVLVTKASGAAGGYPEKLRAAHECGAETFVIGRPAPEHGVSVNEALEIFFEIKPVMRIDLIGTGPGRQGLMTGEAKEALAKADIIFGAPRMIAPYEGRETYPYYLAQDIIPVLEELRPGRAAVLFSGDTGYCSGAAGMEPELREYLSRNGYEHEIYLHPGISSFAYFAARTGVPYTGAGLCSMHGKADDNNNNREIIDTVRTHDRTFLLLSGAEDIRRLGSMLKGSGIKGLSIVIGYQLSYPEEKIELLTTEECAFVTDKGLYTALILNENAAKGSSERAGGSGRALMPVFDDDAFARGKVPMTKANIRHLSIMKLALTEGAVLYDIGSGTGSIACEAAGLSDTVRVYAVEMKPEACALIRENAEKFGFSNIKVIEGMAPAALEGLEMPTHVFIGGSSGNLLEILEALEQKCEGLPSGIRVVINAVSLETISEIHTVLGSFDIRDLSIEQISVSRSRELGSYHMMTAENPVMIAAFTLGGKD